MVPPAEAERRFHARRSTRSVEPDCLDATATAGVSAHERKEPLFI